MYDVLLIILLRSCYFIILYILQLTLYLNLLMKSACDYLKLFGKQTNNSKAIINWAISQLKDC